MSDLVRNPEDRFSHNEAHVIKTPHTSLLSGKTGINRDIHVHVLKIGCGNSSIDVHMGKHILNMDGGYTQYIL